MFNREKQDSLMREYVKNVLERLGGPDVAWRKFDEDLAFFNTPWQQDITALGRILRAHLFVEFHMTRYLTLTNPNLGSIDDARLSFKQKLELLNLDSDINYLKTGINLLNKIRNRVAHSLRAEITDSDAQAFLRLEWFSAMWQASYETQGKTVPTDPYSVMDGFAQHASMLLHQATSDLSSELRRVYDSIENEKMESK